MKIVLLTQEKNFARMASQILYAVVLPGRTLVLHRADRAGKARCLVPGRRASQSIFTALGGNLLQHPLRGGVISQGQV